MLIIFFNYEESLHQIINLSTLPVKCSCFTLRN